MFSHLCCLLLARNTFLALAAPSGVRPGARSLSNATQGCYYTVQTDDNYLFIAHDRFGIPYHELIKLNNKSLPTRDIFPGEKVRVPCKDQLHVAEVETSGPCRERHTVRAGDTCDALSLRFNVAAHALQAYNGLDWQCDLHVGKELCVSKNDLPLCTMRHAVVRGDTCYDLAENNGVSLLDLKAWNPSLIHDHCAIRPGHTVCVKSHEPAKKAGNVSAVQPALKTRTSAAAVPATIRASTAVSQSNLPSSLAVYGNDTKANPSIDLFRFSPSLLLVSYAGNLTTTQLAGGDDQVMLPTKTQLREEPEAFPSVQNDRVTPIALAGGLISFESPWIAPESFIGGLIAAVSGQADGTRGERAGEGTSQIVTDDRIGGGSLDAQSIVDGYEIPQGYVFPDDDYGGKDIEEDDDEDDEGQEEPEEPEEDDGTFWAGT